jgi:predicted ester cyclase
MGAAIGVSNDVAERNKNIVESFQGEIIKKNWAEAKKYLHPDVKVHFPPSPPGSIIPNDADGVIRMFQEPAEWFDFIEVDCSLWVAGEDTLFQVIELHFEHTGNFFGAPPTHKRFSINGLAGFRFKDGLIAEHWGQYDMASIPQKLGLDLPPGAIPTTPPTQPVPAPA